MKTTKTLTIKKTILATVAVAGLVAGTAACGGKNTSSADAEKQALVELLIEAARNGTDEAIAEIIEQADPNVIAQVMPEVAEELDLNFPETSSDAPVAPEVAAPEAGDDIAPEEVAPEASAPEVGAPEASAPEVGAPEDSAPEAEEEATPESGSSGGSTSPRIPGISLPSISSLIGAPQVEGVMFWITGDTTKVTVMVNEKSPLALADVVEVKVTYRFLGMPIVDYGVKGGEVGTNVWSWTIADTVIDNDTEVTFTVKNAAGKVHTYTTTATLSAPL